MKISALYVHPNRPHVTWNVGIDIPNGILSINEYIDRQLKTGGHPDELSFHVHSDKTLSQVVETLTSLLSYDKLNGYRYLPLNMVFDISNVHVTGEGIFNLLNLHFQVKRKELGVIQDAWFDEPI